MVIEVERKFALGRDTERRLRAAGGQPRGGHSFLDRYYDTEQRALTRADHWLRNRSGRWQLKSPTAAAPAPGETPAPGTGETPAPGTGAGTTSGEAPGPGIAPGTAPTPGTAPGRDGGATRYRETETEAEIMAVLRELLPGLADTGLADTGLADTGLADTGLADTGLVDTRLADTGLADTGLADTGLVDTGLADTRLADTGLADTGLVDTGLADTGLADTGLADTGLADTGLADTGLADTGLADTGLVDTGGSGDIERLVTARQLREFAAIHTRRSSWQLPGGVTVDLDQTDFGHRLGEIEVTVAGEDQVPAALSRIQAVAQELGVGDGESIPGKLHVFLEKFRPDHYRELQEAGVL